MLVVLRNWVKQNFNQDTLLFKVKQQWHTRRRLYSCSKRLGFFEMKTMREYHDLYLKPDEFLFADVFEIFRDVCIKYYKLDPAQCFSAPWLTWVACMKKMDVNLELLRDIDMLFMMENGFRASQISKQYSKANNSGWPMWWNKRRHLHSVFGYKQFAWLGNESTAGRC